MNKTVSGKENLYFEMESVRNETEARTYDDVAGESAASATEQTSSKKCAKGADHEKKQNTSSEHENACQCNTVVLRRMLLLMSVVAAVALLTATAALILVLTAMKAEVKGFGSTSAQKSEDEGRTETVSKNVTTLDKKLILRLEKRIAEEELSRKEMVALLMILLKNKTAEQIDLVTTQETIITNLTRRLKSTELELKKVDSALVGQSDGLKNATTSITGLLGEQRDIWKRVNATIEETANLTIKVDQELGNIGRSLNESKLSLLTNMTSQLKDFQTKVDHRFQRLEARIDVGEQKSNSTRQITELHFQKIQNLNVLLNITLQDIKNVSRHHSEALSMAGNLSKTKFHGVWTALNTTTNDLLVQIQKATDKLTEQLNQTQELLQSSDASLFASLIRFNASITEKVNNVSKMEGPIGPPGFNGSQGPAGPSGAVGPPGSQGSGDFSACQYKVEAGTYHIGASKTLTSKTESTGKRILGAACSTNFAAECNLKSQQQQSGKWKYVCDCRGPSTVFTQRRDPDKKCFLHYWECPLTT